MTLPGLVADKNLSDAVDNAQVWNNLGANVNATATTTNLVTQSEDFTTAPWSTFGSFISGNVAVAPDNTTTADKLVPITGNVDFARSVIIVLPQPTTAPAYVLSIFVKPDEFSTLEISVEPVGSTVSRTACIFDLISGDINPHVSPENIFLSQIIPQSNGWSRLALGLILSTVNSFRWRIITGRLPQVPNSTSGLLLWGAQAEEGYFLTDYKKTTGTVVTRQSPITFQLTANDILALNGASRASAVDFIRTKGLASNVQPRISAAAAAAASGTVLRDNALSKVSPVSEGHYALSRGILNGNSLQVNGIGLASISGSPFSGSTATAPLSISSLGMPQDFRVSEEMASGTLTVPSRAIPIETEQFILYAKAGQS